MTAQPTVTVTVRYRFQASAERVFDAWLDPQIARQFLFATPTGKMVRAEVDPRVGGKFVFADLRDGEEIEHVGEYLELDRPRRLVFQFQVPKFWATPTRVEIDIVPLDTGCELTLKHDGVFEEYQSRTTEGWSKILAGLAAALS